MSASLYSTLGHAKWAEIRKAVGAPPMPELTQDTKPVSLVKPPRKVSLAKKPVFSK